jgi:hypothetical protein
MRKQHQDVTVSRQNASDLNPQADQRVDLSGGSLTPNSKQIPSGNPRVTSMDSNSKSGQRVLKSVMKKILKSFVHDPEFRAQSIFWIGLSLLLLTAFVLMLVNGTYR